MGLLACLVLTVACGIDPPPTPNRPGPPPTLLAPQAMDRTGQAAKPQGRPGLVRSAGGVYVDDGGPFRPRGTTLLWALYGWTHGDQPRVRDHFAYIQRKQAHYVRACASVNWEGQEIDPTRPNYVAELAGLIDAAYDEFGLRTKVTAVCGGPWNPLETARQVVAAVQGRQHKVFALEATNEGNLDEARTIEVARILKTSGVPLVSVGMGDQGIDAIRRASEAAGATKIDFHTSRGEADAGALQLRQAWDFTQLLGPPIENAEPPGPASSVGELTDPFKLGAFRTLSIILGAGAFCFHTGNGVFGRAHVASNDAVRQASLWEAPGVDAMFNAVFEAGEWLPEGIENWPKYNEKHRSPIYADGDLNAVYGASDGVRFAYMAFGVARSSTIEAQKPITVRLRHPVSGEVLATHALAAGQSVPGPALWAYVLEGNVR